MRVEVQSEWSSLVKVKLSQERQAALRLAVGIEVYLRPIQKRAFIDGE